MDNLFFFSPDYSLGPFYAELPLELPFVPFFLGPSKYMGVNALRTFCHRLR